ncbi:DNA polymerase eta [Novymonas esmeraldas]|uniref:DNA polymerase eta n=1 Tax=Novymonas esmeraldas TaxID=1808958 RepID=A0AAW0F4K6_9TRYP
MLSCAATASAGEVGGGSVSPPPRDNTASASPTDPMRCIAHIDMDCFYAQVEAVRLGVDCRVTPYALLQWGSFIAVNYPARARGVRRFRLSPDEVRRDMPDVQMSHIATYAMGESEYGYPSAPRINTHKVSLEPYRRASRQIFAILRSEPGVLVGKAGIDEAYVDVTEAARWELAEVRAAAAGAPLDALADVLEPSTRLIEDRRAEMEAWLGERGASLAAVFDGPMRALQRGECGAGLEGSRAFCVGAGAAAYGERCLLLCAASRVVRRLRQRIYAELHYDCSAGIAHNRVLAKCISATHKPNQQTLLLPDRSASALFELPLSALRGFGGKFGAAVSAVCGGATECREVWLVPLAQLRRLDGTCGASDDEDDGDGEEVAAVRRRDQKPGDGGGGGDRAEDGGGDGAAAVQSGAGVYTYFRLRGFGSAAVTDPAPPRSMGASKIFHPACTSWTAARLWMAPMAGELWHRFSECESQYCSEGRSLVVAFRTYVPPEDVQRGQRSSAYRTQVPLPPSVLTAQEVAAMSLRELVRLMEEVTRGAATGRRPVPNAAPPSPSLPEGLGEDALPMPPLRIIELSIIGLRLRAPPGGGGGGAHDAGPAAAPQRSLADMFAALSAHSAAVAREKAASVAEEGSETHPRKRRRSATRGEACARAGTPDRVEVTEVDDDVEVGDSGDAACVVPNASRLSAPPVQPAPQPPRTLEDFFQRPRTAAAAVVVAPAATVPVSASARVPATPAEVEEDGVALVGLPRQQLSCVSITEVSSEHDEDGATVWEG